MSKAAWRMTLAAFVTGMGMLGLWQHDEYSEFVLFIGLLSLLCRLEKASS